MLKARTTAGLTVGLDSELSSFTTTQLTHLHPDPSDWGAELGWDGLGVFGDCERAQGTSVGHEGKITSLV